MKGLKDKVPSIRAVSAGAISKLVDSTVPEDVRRHVKGVLRSMVEGDPSAMVQKAAAHAVKTLESKEKISGPRSTESLLRRKCWLPMSAWILRNTGSGPR